MEECNWWADCFLCLFWIKDEVCSIKWSWEARAVCDERYGWYGNTHPLYSNCQAELCHSCHLHGEAAPNIRTIEWNKAMLLDTKAEKCPRRESTMLAVAITGYQSEAHHIRTLRRLLFLSYFSIEDQMNSETNNSVYHRWLQCWLREKKARGEFKKVNTENI